MISFLLRFSVVIEQKVLFITSANVVAISGIGSVEVKVVSSVVVIEG